MERITALQPMIDKKKACFRLFSRFCPLFTREKFRPQCLRGLSRLGKKNCKILTNHPHLLSEDGQIAWVDRSCVVRRASWVVGCELRANNESKRSSRHAIIEQELSFLTYDLKCRGGSRGRVQGVRTPPPALRLPAVF